MKGRSPDMKASISALVLALLASACYAAAANRADGAIIRNTGSTNFSGYTIKVWSDGRTSTVHSDRNGRPLDQPATGKIPQSVANQFFTDVRGARGNPSGAQPCLKSASFGTTTIVQYHGWTSPDLECSGNGFVISVGSDVHKIVALLNVQGISARKIPLLPNEPRRTEPSPNQASPSPEPAPSAS